RRHRAGVLRDLALEAAAPGAARAGAHVIARARGAARTGGRAVQRLAAPVADRPAVLAAARRVARDRHAVRIAAHVGDAGAAAGLRRGAGAVDGLAAAVADPAAVLSAAGRDVAARGRAVCRHADAVAAAGVPGRTGAAVQRLAAAGADL